MTRCIILTIETLLFREDVQIKGLNVIIYCSNLTFAHTTMWPASEKATFIMATQKSIPMRWLKVSLINLPRVLWFALEFAKQFLSSKMKNRIFTNGKIEDFVNLPKEINLQNDKTMDEITLKWIEIIEKHENELKSLDNYHIYLDKKSVKDVNSNVESNKSKWSLWPFG